MVSAAFRESSFLAHKVNPDTGAEGLFQLLSPKYITRAQACGGALNARCNVQTILPYYLAYWRKHPHARPGQAAAAVEASFKSDSYYAGPLACLPWRQIER